MADSYTTLQLDAPCTMNEATDWWAEVQRVMGDGDAEVSVTVSSSGIHRITVHVHDQT